MFMDILQSIASVTGLSVTGLIVTTIVLVYKFARPFIEKKATTEDNAQLKQALEAGLKYADAFVPEMAVMAGLSKSDRKKEATRLIKAELAENGITLSDSVISALTEQAYQAYKTTGGDNHTVTSEPTDTVEDVVDDVEDDAEPEEAGQTITVDPMEADAIGAGEDLTSTPTLEQAVETPESKVVSE